MAIGDFENAKIELKDLPKFLNKLVTSRQKRALDVWKDAAQDLAKQLVDDSIGKGISPVKGGGDSTGGRPRYKEYSETYKEKIKRYISDKRIRPVNLKVSGKMRASLKSRTARDGIYLWYADEKAKYHNRKGAGKSLVKRQLLPLKGQQFSRTITSKLQKLYVDLFDKIK